MALTLILAKARNLFTQWPRFGVGSSKDIPQLGRQEIRMRKLRRNFSPLRRHELLDAGPHLLLLDFTSLLLNNRIKSI